MAQILHSIRYLESLQGERINKCCKMSGALELDAASLRKVRVGPKSLKYKALIEDWKQQAAWWQESSSTLLAVRSDLRML